jgi:alpha-mannosidase
MRGAWRIGFALFPHSGGWLDGGVAAAAEAHRHPPLWAHGSGPRDATWPPAGAGTEALSLEGDAVDLSALRRLETGWIEVRVVNLAPEPRRAVLRGALTAGRAASILGEPVEPLPVADGALVLELGPAEIRTVQVRRSESALGRAEILDAAGPRQHA